MRTPGREDEAELEEEEAANISDQPAGLGARRAPTGTATAMATAVATESKAEQLIAAFGGRDNLVNVDACITRLRMEVANKDKVDKARLRELGAAGVIGR